MEVGPVVQVVQPELQMEVMVGQVKEAVAEAQPKHLEAEAEAVMV